MKYSTQFTTSAARTPLRQPRVLDHPSPCFYTVAVAVAEGVAELEVIDPSSAGAVEAIDRACRSLGFFRIPLSVIEPTVADAAWNDALAFFSLPEAEKQAVAFPEPGYPYGYSPFAFESLAASIDQPSAPDLKESFSVGPDCAGPIPVVTDNAERWLRSPSQWPQNPVTLQATWSAYYRELSTVSEGLLSLMAIALELPEDYFRPLIDRHTSAIRALRYPALVANNPAVRGGALRAGAHSDYGTVTILRTDGVVGLEVQTLDGTWVPVAPEPETFVVNLGDSIAQWTNDRWRSTLHRVSTASNAERHSMAFFHMANWDTVIECLPTCREPGLPPRHQPAMAGPWLMEKFARSVA